MKQVTVVAAIIIQDEQILCVQRGESKLPYISKKYEFPGGKVEAGETLSETVIREIREELDMDIIPMINGLREGDSLGGRGTVIIMINIMIVIDIINIIQIHIMQINGFRRGSATRPGT